MISFSSYAEQKFEILNKHKVFITREAVIDAVASPEKTGRRGRLFCAYKEGIGVIYRKEGGGKRVITFYPVNM